MQKPEYRINQEAYALHRNNYYLIDVVELKYDAENSKYLYKIHWKKWGKKWDEWVTRERLSSKFITIDANTSKKTKKKTDNKNTNSKEKCQSSIKKSKNTENTASKRSKQNDDRSEKANKRSKINHDVTIVNKKLNIKIPLCLQSKLLQEYEHICFQKMLYPLPRTPTVTSILNENCNKNEIMDRDATEGIKNYFNESLSKLLLYSSEYEQFHKYEKLNPVDVYGAEHLLRLMVKLPSIVNISEKHPEINYLLDKIQSIIKYMVSAPSIFLANELFIKNDYT